MREDREDQALAGIPNLKRSARDNDAWLWPNHDIDFSADLPPRVALG